MDILIEVDDSKIRDALLSGVSGIAYWCSSLHHEQGYPWVDGKWIITEHASLGGGKSTLDRLAILRGVQAAIKYAPRVLGAVLGGDRLDSLAGDTFIQLCCFGEVRYL